MPNDQFVVVGSGPLSLKNIRESKDLDLIVTSLLWAELAKKYPMAVNAFGVERLDLGNDIEVLNPVQSLFGNSEVVPFDEVFEKVDTSDGIKFLNLAHLRAVKLKIGRKKDLEDIALIDTYLDL